MGRLDALRMNCRDKRDKRDGAGHSAAETLQVAATSATLRNMILVRGCPVSRDVADVADGRKVAKPRLTRHVADVADVASRGGGNTGGRQAGRQADELSGDPPRPVPTCSDLFRAGGPDLFPTYSRCSGDLFPLL
jgi:hypothetical protein